MRHGTQQKLIVFIVLTIMAISYGYGYSYLKGRDFSYYGHTNEAGEYIRNTKCDGSSGDIDSYDEYVCDYRQGRKTFRSVVLFIDGIKFILSPIWVPVNVLGRMVN